MPREAKNGKRFVSFKDYCYCLILTSYTLLGKLHTALVRLRPGSMELYTYNTPELRIALFTELKQCNIRKHEPSPVRRVFIPKPNTEELRPLGVPSIIIKDRVIQMVVKNALEPEWEAIFEKGSYGFRPKRSVNDAINSIYLLLNSKNSRTWVLDADIAKCFDKISHEYLIEKMQTFPGKDLINNQMAQSWH